MTMTESSSIVQRFGGIVPIKLSAPDNSRYSLGGVRVSRRGAVCATNGKGAFCAVVGEDPGAGDVNVSAIIAPESMKGATGVAWDECSPSILNAAGSVAPRALDGDFPRVPEVLAHESTFAHAVTLSADLLRKALDATDADTVTLLLPENPAKPVGVLAGYSATDTRSKARQRAEGDRCAHAFAVLMPYHRDGGVSAMRKLWADAVMAFKLRW